MAQSQDGEQARGARSGRTEYFDLQILRALAALGVVLDHSAIITSERGGGYTTLLERTAMFLGYSGVWIFFVISGFIMMVTRERAEHNPGGSIRFLRSRIIRIYPLYLSVTLLKAVQIFGEFSTKELFLSLSFVPYFNSQGLMRPLVGQGWTLVYEMFFYLVFAASLVLKKLYGLIFLYLVLFLLFVAGGIAEIFAFEAGAAFATYTDPIMLFFLAGITVYLLRRDLPAFGMRNWPMMSLVYGALIGLFVFLDSSRLGESWAANIALGLLCALLVFVSVSGVESRPNKIAKLLHFLGGASYSIYLTHTFVLLFLKKLGLTRVGDVAFMLSALVASCVVGGLVYQYFEKPAGAWAAKLKWGFSR